MAVRAAIDGGFADWKSGADPLVDTPEPAEGRVAVDIIDRPDASQSNVLQGLPDSYPTDYVISVRALTSEDISEMARKYLGKDDMTPVIAGGRGRIGESVAPYLGNEEE